MLGGNTEPGQGWVAFLLSLPLQQPLRLRVQQPNLVALCSLFFALCSLLLAPELSRLQLPELDPAVPAVPARFAVPSRCCWDLL